uniref:alpha-1,2-Mannosidase n=1 Tax=Corethron hystrix TaxID=216773 RepID=A0A7S1B773_9STRA
MAEVAAKHLEGTDRLHRHAGEIVLDSSGSSKKKKKKKALPHPKPQPEEEEAEAEAVVIATKRNEIFAHEKKTEEKKETKPETKKVELPKIGGASVEKDDPENRRRRDAVRDAMRHAWGGYEKYAFGKDEVSPLSHRAVENWGGMGNTLVDSLDTLWIMELYEEFDRAKEWVRTKLHYNVQNPISTFETTIRSLGGLLAAYDRSGDAVFLTKAVDLGDRLLATFNTKSGLPSGQSLLKKGTGGSAGWLRGSYVLAEVATLQVEFRYLAAVTGNRKYATTSEKVFHMLKEVEPEDGLYPYKLGWDAHTNKIRFTNTQISFGAMGDSFYEYLLKVWIQGGKKESMYREMYDKSIDGMANKLIQKTKKEKLTYIAERSNGRLQHKMDHLACFMGGLLALGAYTDPGGLDSERAQRDLQLAKDITYTCYQMYKQMPSGIAPEFSTFDCGRGRDLCPGRARYYILRPETVESLFVLHQLTGDPVYRQWGWEIFQAIEKHCRTQIAYAGLKDVSVATPVKDDKMESFFLAETIKYLYLLFDEDGKVDLLGRHVFNTEAHPLRWITDEELLKKVEEEVK